MKIFTLLDKFVLYELFILFFLNMLFCFNLFVMNFLLKISNIITKYNVDISSIFSLVFCTLPYFFKYIIPMSVAMSILTTCLKMNYDNEIVALKSFGIRVIRLVKPFIIFSIVGVFITLLLTTFLVPDSKKKSKILFLNIVLSNTCIGIKEKKLGFLIKNLSIYVNRINKNGDKFYRLFIEDNRKCNYKKIVFSSRAILIRPSDRINKMYVRFHNGTFILVDKKKKCVEYIDFKRLNVELNIKKITDELNKKNIKIMNIIEIKRLIMYKKKKMDYIRKNFFYNTVLVYFYKMLSFPFSCLSMGIVSMFVGMKNFKINKTVSFALCSLIFLVYYILSFVGNFLSESMFWPPLIGAWFANIVFIIIGLYIGSDNLKGK